MVEGVSVKFDSAATLAASDLSRWHEAVSKASGGPKVLIATTVTGFHHVTTVESVLGLSLTLRGAEAHYFVCDGALPGCMYSELDRVPDISTFERYELGQRVCGGCTARGSAAYDTLGLPIHRLSAFVTDEQRIQAREIPKALSNSDIQAFTVDGMAIGEHAYAGVLRYFARGDLDGVADADIVMKRYLESALLTMYSVLGLLKREQFDAVVFHHGIYVPQGVIGEVCRKLGVRLVNWNPSYRKNTFIFSHGDTYHHTLMDEPMCDWEDMDWSPAHEREIMNYLYSRNFGTRDWIWFHERPDSDFTGFAKEVGIDLSRPLVGMLTNVMWDAQLHYPSNAFPSMLAWLIQTIRWFAGRPGLQLVIRVHPAELRGTAPSRQPVVDEIHKVFPTLPANVFVIPPESQVSTYAAMSHCDSVLIYGTKTGVELTSVGIPVLVGGEAWIRGKGLTLDASSPQEWFQFLDRLPLGERMDEATAVLARKYAFHFFFRRMIPLPFIGASKRIYSMALSTLDEIAPGGCAGLDVICRGIIEGRPFIYPAEVLGLHDSERPELEAS